MRKLSNLHFAYCQTQEIGTIREVFIASMLQVNHNIKLAKKGDFLVDDTITLEVGGAKKRYKQIQNIPNSFVVADDIEIGHKNKIPLWLFGFLY